MKDNIMSGALAWEVAVEQHNAALPKHPRHKHDFSKTIQSFGAWGDISECVICGRRAIFVISDDQG